MQNNADSSNSISPSYPSAPQGYPLNSHHSVLELAADSPVAALTQGIYHQVDDWVALELTAEQMLRDEVQLVGGYIANDAKQMWNAIKDNCLPYELALEDMLKRAAGAPDQI